MLLISYQSNYSFGQIHKKTSLLNKKTLKNNVNIKTIQKCSAQSLDKPDIIDKFFKTKFGKIIKKIYCFGLDIDEITN